MKNPIILTVSAFLCLSILLWCCNQPEEKATATVSTFKPVPLPDPGIPGYHFPEDSNLIYKWIQTGDTASMYKHSWGIWASLTAMSGEKVGGDEMRVFETWYTPNQVYLMMNKLSNNSDSFERPRTDLEVPRQFTHHLPFAERAAVLENDSTQKVLVTMKYDPSTVKHVLQNKLLDSTVLNSMLKNGAGSIPAFPNTSVAIKPTYEVIKVKELRNGLYSMKIWTGPPNPDTIAYPNKKWPACVYIDINGKGKGNGSVDSTLQNPTPQNTYNLDNFIYFKIDKKTAELINREGLKGGGVSEGDFVVLVAMHISTKEIKQWVWQSMWWAPNADTPPLPSYGTIAAQRPAQLKGAARHYALTTAYYMVKPNQPYSGGVNIGTALYAFNPYLEAGFGPSVFEGTVPSVLANNKGVTIRNYVGVRTNCMSCHGMATYAPAGNSLNYVGDRYIDMKSAFFKNYIQVDFLWSIQGVASAPPKTTKP